MIRDIENQEHFFIVKCSKLECVVLSESFEEAVNEGMLKILKKFGENTNLSLIISVDKIKDYELESNFYLTSVILSDLGYFKLAEDLDSLSDFFLDKGKNPH